MTNTRVVCHLSRLRHRYRLSGSAALGVLSVLALLLAGCSSGNGSGYRWESLYREDVQSVAVPIFANKQFERGVEFRLTQAVVQQIEARTPYKVVSRSDADTILEGEIVRVLTDPISIERRSAQPQEQLYTLVVNFTWKDLRTGKVLRQRKNFEQSTPYYPTLGEGAFFGSQDAVEKLAVAIVQELEADW